MEQTNYELGMMPQKPSSMLNVLTILTIIGSVIGLISGVWNYINASDAYQQMLTAKNSPEMADAPGFVKAFINDDALKMAKSMMENKLPIMLLTLLGSALCLYGAIEMRKLKKQGYTVWMAGELLPLLAMIPLVGVGAYGGFGAIALVFPVAMIIMYTICKKELS
jgi:hypothetical protein